MKTRKVRGAAQRDALAVAWTAIAMGSFASPIVLVALGAPSHFAPLFSFVTLPLFALSIGLLFGMSIRQTRVEYAVCQRIGRTATAVRVFVIIVAMCTLYGLFALMMNFSLFTQAEYRFGVATVLIFSSVVALLPVRILPPSRLECWLGSLLTTSSGAHRWCRFCGWVFLALVIAWCCQITYDYATAIPEPPG